MTYMNSSESSKVHLRFLKFVLGLKRNCSNSATLGEVGQFPLMLRGFVHLLTYWHRLANLSYLTLAKQAFLTSKWIETVRNLNGLLLLNT